MSHRIHGNHHLHTHPHAFDEAGWVKHLESKGYIVEQIPQFHWEHVNAHHWSKKYQVFKVTNGVKELIHVDEHGKEQP